MKHNVVLNDGTVGTIDDDTVDYQDLNDFIGERMSVHLFDENGNSIEKEGILTEVLD
jgi:hypothetical protein